MREFADDDLETLAVELFGERVLATNVIARYCYHSWRAGHCTLLEAVHIGIQELARHNKILVDELVKVQLSTPPPPRECRPCCETLSLGRTDCQSVPTNWTATIHDGPGCGGPDECDGPDLVVDHVNIS